MYRLSKHLRGLLVAIAALALSAGVVFASRPTAAPANGPDGVSTPVVADDRSDEPNVPDADDDQEEDGEDGEDGETAPDVDLEPDAEDPDAESSERAQNHGWFVSEAAHQATPDGYKNHGEYVSEVARGDDGKPKADDPESAEADGATTKTKGSDRSSEAKARNAERTSGRGSH